MSENTNKWRALPAGLALLIGLAAAVVLLQMTRQPAQTTPLISADDLEAASERTVLVYVSGEVQHPGLYRLPASNRVVDAMVASGGITTLADPACLPNLAARLQDGKQVAFPALGRCPRPRAAKLDINGATRAQLVAIPGIDPLLADAIIAYREQYGGFQRVDELKSGLGVDAELYARLKQSLIVP
jgi:competence protein ComEA